MDVNACYAASLSLWRAADSIGRALHAHTRTAATAPVDTDGSATVRASPHHTLRIAARAQRPRTGAVVFFMVLFGLL